MLLLQQEENARSSESNTSYLGLLTLINEYGAQFGWRFEVHLVLSEMMTVTTSGLQERPREVA
jgi:hypothetical protein